MPNEETVLNPGEETIPPNVGGDPAMAPATPNAGRRATVDLSQAPPEALPYIEAARQQEKQKLYKDLKDTADLRRTVTDLTRQLDTLKQQVPAAVAPTAAPAGSLDEQIASLRDMITETRNLIVQRDRESDLRAYRAERIAELRGAGVGFVEALVTGNTREDIDLSLELAKAEYMQIEADIEARRTPPPAPPQMGARPVVVNQGNARPRGVPPVVNAGSVAQTGPTVTEAEVKELTSFDAIRSGDFKANRKRLHDAIKNGGVVR